LKREIQAILPVGNSKISRLCKVLQDGINTLHTRRPPRIPTHALHDNDLDTIKANVESWEVEDSFPYTQKVPKTISFRSETHVHKVVLEVQGQDRIHQ
jgi:hypothetical protein